MGKNRGFVTLAVAVIAAATTALYYRYQVRTAQEQADILRRQIGAIQQQGSGSALSELERSQAYLRGQHDTVAQSALIQAELSILADQERMSMLTLRTELRPALSPENFRRAQKQMFDRQKQMYDRMPQLISLAAFGPGGVTLIDGREYDLPPSTRYTGRIVDGDQTVMLDRHVLRIHSGVLVWDGAYYGAVPIGGHAVIKADGSVTVDGVARLPHPAPSGGSASRK